MSAVAVDTKKVEARMARTASLWFVVLSICLAVLLTYLAVHRFQQILLPEVLNKTRVIGASVRVTVEHALELGIPFDDLAGMDDFLDDTLAENPEIAFIRVAGDGHNIYLRKRQVAEGSEIITQEISGSGAKAAVTLGVRASYLNEKMYLMYGDAAAILVVALVAGLEVALFFSYRWLLRPLETWRSMINGLVQGDLGRTLHGRITGPFAELLRLSEQRIARLRGEGVQPLLNWYRPAAHDIRTALFLFVLSEELLRSFFPLYVKELVGSGSPLYMQLAISAPLIAYMSFAALGNMIGGGLVERIGMQRMFMLSCLLAVLSLCGLSAATNLPEVIVCRSVSAMAYALATIVCQVYVARTFETGTGSAGLSTFVAAVTAACICGAPIGAVLADIFGKPAALLCAAALAFFAWLAFRSIVFPPAAAVASDARPAAISYNRLLLGHWRIAVMLCCAVAPGKMLLAGMLFYITPLLLQQFGFSQASIGQFFILFYVLILAGNHLSRKITNDIAQTSMVVIGSIIAGGGALMLYWFPTSFTLAAAIVCFGFGQSITQTPVVAMMLSVVRRDLPQVPPARVVGLSRIFERGGSICGAAAAAFFSGTLGYTMAAAALGAIAIVFGFCTVLLMRSTKKMQRAAC